MNSTISLFKKYPTIGVCGLDCGLCPRYYTSGASRCPGCAGSNFFNKHPSCSFITCCIKKNSYEVCSDCPDFPCHKFKRNEEYQQLKGSSSYPPLQKIMQNFNYVKEFGIEKFIENQKKRIRLLETMIENFNDGRSKSLFCKATALLDISSLENAINKADKKIKSENIKQADFKTKAKILKYFLNNISDSHESD